MALFVQCNALRKGLTLSSAALSDLSVELLLFRILGCPEVTGNGQVPPGDHAEHVVICRRRQ